MAHPIHREIQQPRLNYEQVRALISSEPSCASLPDRQNGYTPLHTAARRGDPQLIRVLIECGAELEARIAGSGQTPFLIACQMGDVRVVHCLAEGGADCRAVDSTGKSAVHYASIVGSVSVLHYLVEILHLDPKAIDSKGNTALHYAVDGRVTLSLSYLLKHKHCDVAQANLEGMTPLHLAAKNGSMKMVWELLYRSRTTESLTLRNAQGLTAEELARQGNSKSHKAVAVHLSRWHKIPSLMRLSPWLYWTVFILMPGFFMIIADLLFCYLHNPTMALILGVLIAGAGFYFPVLPHRIPHESGWHNPAFMGAMLTEVSHTASCYLVRVMPLLWPGHLLLLCFLILNSIFGLYIFMKFKLTDPGFDKTGKLGAQGKPLTILDVAGQQHTLSHSQLQQEASTGTTSVLQFCDTCEIIIPDRTKHCKLCNACCNGFDHHCLWLTSCVGMGNHRLFVLFNIALTIEGLIFLWGGVAGLSVAMGEDFPWNLFKGDMFAIEKWIKFRILITICSVLYTSKILHEQLSNISRLETTYFDLSGKASYKTKRHSSFPWSVRLKLVYLFFSNYQQWYHKSSQSATVQNV